MTYWLSITGVGGGGVEKINNKDHLSPAEAGRLAELGNCMRGIIPDYDLFVRKVRWLSRRSICVHYICTIRIYDLVKNDYFTLNGVGICGVWILCYFIALSAFTSALVGVTSSISNAFGTFLCLALTYQLVFLPFSERRLRNQRKIFFRFRSWYPNSLGIFLSSKK